MSHRFLCAVLSVALFVAGGVTRVYAQGLTASLSGVVTDTGGGVMPGATVTIKNVGTNLVKETVTGSDGAFVFPDLLAGTFDLTVNVQGFKSYEQKGIVIGRGGEKLKAIGTRARKDIEHFLEGRVHLELNVKVAERWSDDPRALVEFGYTDKETSPAALETEFDDEGEDDLEDFEAGADESS